MSERQTRVAIQGEENSYHDVAAKHLYGKNYEAVYCDTFPEVFDALQNKKVDVAVSAIQNTLYGSIDAVHDILGDRQDSLRAVAEVEVEINHALIGLPGSQIDDLRRVRSHAVALGQCKDIIAERGLETHVSSDTAGSVGEIKELGDLREASIASVAAAAAHDCVVLQERIQDDPNNITRFLAFRRRNESYSEKVEVGQPAKTSLILGNIGLRSNSSSAGYDLLTVLEAFDSQGIDMTKLEPRPVVKQGRPEHPRYFLDVNSAVERPHMQAALKQISKQRIEAHILGSYAKGDRI